SDTQPTPCISARSSCASPRSPSSRSRPRPSASLSSSTSKSCPPHRARPSSPPPHPRLCTLAPHDTTAALPRALTRLTHLTTLALVPTPHTPPPPTPHCPTCLSPQPALSARVVIAAAPLHSFQVGPTPTPRQHRAQQSSPRAISSSPAQEEQAREQRREPRSVQEPEETRHQRD
ncbi:hypothetical protein C8J57DRAFT_1591264, partial [Mycena rebaudengoi]